jgi:glycosyltransferase involved in cell wall biosynthesis
MVGDGPLSAILARQAIELGIGSKVKFYGFRPNIDEYLAAMDIFVQPSHREGSPTAVLEAMAAGVATVAVRSAGCIELHQSHGLPLLVGSDAEALAQVLHELAGDPHRRAELGAQGRRIVSESFSFDRVVDSYEHLYRSLAAAESETGVAAIQQVGVGLE